MLGGTVHDTARGAPCCVTLYKQLRQKQGGKDRPRGGLKTGGDIFLIGVR